MPNSLDKEPLSSQEEFEQPLIQRKFGSYILGRTLGTGASSKVKLGVHEHTGNKNNPLPPTISFYAELLIKCMF